MQYRLEKLFRNSGGVFKRALLASNNTVGKINTNQINMSPVSERLILKRKFSGSSRYKEILEKIYCIKLRHRKKVISIKHQATLDCDKESSETYIKKLSPIGLNGMQYRLGELFCGPGGMSKGALLASHKKIRKIKPKQINWRPVSELLILKRKFSGSSRNKEVLEKTYHIKPRYRKKVYSIKHQWASDYDKDSCETYIKNICPDSPQTVYHCDVKDLEIPSLSQIDILAFGFPCNDFSIVGETKGMDGKFGMLYQYGVNVLKEHNPMAFVAENVSGIKGANGGKAWQKITTDLEKAGKGYDLYVHHYYFEHYGVPQMRHRYIIVGIRKDLNLKFQHPEPTTKENPRTCYDALHDPEIPEGTSHHEIRELQSRVQERLSFIKPGDNAWSEDIPPHLRLNVKGARLSNIYRRMHPDLPAYTITGSGGGGTHGYHWSENRALTNREKARVQTFPDSYEFVGGATSVRKQIGMAVPPLGAKIIFEALLKCLSNKK